MNDPYALAINVHRRDNGQLVSQRLFFPSEINMAEGFRRQYDGTEWHCVGVPLMTNEQVDRWLEERDA